MFFLKKGSQNSEEYFNSVNGLIWLGKNWINVINKLTLVIIMTIFIGALIVWKALSEATFQRGAFFEIPENVEHEVHALVDSYLYLIK